jgi:hypothetical protein
MSRGLGTLQSTILERISDLGGKVLQNQLLWTLAQENVSIKIGKNIYEDVAEGTITDSFKNNFGRALNKLIQRRTIHLSPLRINDLDSLLQFYPYKTFRYEIFMLRKRLLPLVKTFITSIDEGTYHPTSNEGYKKFGTTNNERFVLDNLNRSSTEYYEQCKERWSELESELLGVALNNSNRRNLWVRLMVKGRELFIEKYKRRPYYSGYSVEVSPITYSMSASKLLEDLSSCSVNMSQPELSLLAKIGAFKQDVFSDTHIDRAVLKTQLYRVAHFSRKGSARFNDEFKRFIFLTCTDLVRSLPGHQDPPNTLYGRGKPIQYSPLIDKIIDGRILAEFRFVS